MASVDALITDLNKLVSESNEMRHELGLHADHAALDQEITKAQEDVFDLIREAKTLIQTLGATAAEIEILGLDVIHEQNVLKQIRGRMDRFIESLQPRDPIPEEDDDDEDSGPEYVGSLGDSDEEVVYDSDDEL